jgi:hypothetical protein
VGEWGVDSIRRLPEAEAHVKGCGGGYTFRRTLLVRDSQQGWRTVAPEWF